MSTLVITTFSEDGYHLYGKRMVDTWCRHWPQDYTLRLYVEHNLTVDDPRVEVINLHNCSPSLVKFKNNSYSLAEQTQDKKKRNKILKTVKWCHKVYAMAHALESNHDYLIFLDGDTYSRTTVPSGQLESLVGFNLFAVHFEHLQGMPHYETGLIIFNKRHSQIQDLKDNITSAYDTGEIFKLPKSWDGFWIAELHKRRNYQVLDLAGGRRTGVFTNPAVSGILAHDAGKKKYQGTNYNKYTGKTKQKGKHGVPST